MARISITLPDPLAEAVCHAAGDNVSGWVADLVKQELLHRAAAAAGAYDRAHHDPDWETDRIEGAA